MDQPYNPLAGTSLSDTWFYKRRAPKSRVAHYIHPVHLVPLCDTPMRKDWLFVDGPLKMCVKCRGIELQASVAEEIDNERLK